MGYALIRPYIQEHIVNNQRVYYIPQQHLQEIGPKGGDKFYRWYRDLPNNTIQYYGGDDVTPPGYWKIDRSGHDIMVTDRGNIEVVNGNTLSGRAHQRFHREEPVVGGITNPQTVVTLQPGVLTPGRTTDHIIQYHFRQGGKLIPKHYTQK